MNERTAGRLGILESMAIVLAIAVACLAVARAEPGPRGCVTTAASVGRDADAPAKARADPAIPNAVSHDADATDMLLHD